MAVAALAASIGLAQAADDDQHCKVTDPTGTPLNLRDKPNGRIIGTLKNGMFVSVTEYANDAKGRPWVDVADYNTKKVLGWVFREFISCF
jgi:hypothetical protein